MIDSENHTGVPPKELQAPGISRWDLMIPMALFVVVAGLLFLAFQQRETAHPKTHRMSLADVPTKHLTKLSRTVEVAAELLRRKDISLETADSCVRRLAAVRNQSPADICMNQIQQLPSNTSKSVQRRWVTLLSKFGSPEAQQVKPEGEHARRILLAADLSQSPESIPGAFAEAVGLQQRYFLLSAIPLIHDKTTSRICLEEIWRQVITPACTVPEAADTSLIAATIQTIAAMNVSEDQQTSVYCELAIHGICRPECFRQLSRQPLDTICDSHRGHLAAALLDYLFLQDRLPVVVQDPEITSFAQGLASVFRGSRHDRYVNRLHELQPKLEELAKTVQTPSAKDGKNTETEPR